MRNYKICVSICVELDGDMYFPERFQLDPQDVLSIRSKLGDDAEQYMMEILVQKILQASVEDLGAKCGSMWSSSEAWDQP